MPRLKREPIEPETRAGHCCGCHSIGTLPLFKVQGMFRYRCSACFERETGSSPLLGFS
jgi:hypothetical protein